MNKKNLFAVGAFLVLLSCGSGNHDKATVSECMRGDNLRAITQDEIDERIDEETLIFEPFAEIISIEDGTLTIEYADYFNCANHIKYNTETEIDESDPETLLVEIHRDYGDVLAKCSCPKVLRFKTKGVTEDLKKLKFLKVGSYEEVIPLNPADSRK